MVDAVIVSTARTPIGKAVRGAFNLTHGADMGGHVIAARRQARRHRSGRRRGRDDGLRQSRRRHRRQHRPPVRHPRRPAGDGRRARPSTASAPPGLQAIALAAYSIKEQGVPVAVAGGLESISLVQMNMNTKFYRNDWIVEHKGAIYMPMIETADIVAKRYGISRQKQDEYCADEPAAHRRGQKAGRFDDEIVPLTTVDGGREQGDQGDLQAHRHAGARTRATAPTPRWRASPSSSPCAATTSSSPPATPASSPTAPRPAC